MISRSLTCIHGNCIKLLHDKKAARIRANSFVPETLSFTHFKRTTPTFASNVLYSRSFNFYNIMCLILQLEYLSTWMKERTRISLFSATLIFFLVSSSNCTIAISLERFIGISNYIPTHTFPSQFLSYSYCFFVTSVKTRRPLNPESIANYHRILFRLFTRLY